MPSTDYKKPCTKLCNVHTNDLVLCDMMYCTSLSIRIHLLCLTRLVDIHYTITDNFPFLVCYMTKVNNRVKQNTCNKTA